MLKGLHKIGEASFSFNLCPYAEQNMLQILQPFNKPCLMLYEETYNMKTYNIYNVYVYIQHQNLTYNI